MNIKDMLRSLWRPDDGQAMRLYYEELGRGAVPCRCPSNVMLAAWFVGFARACRAARVG